MFLHFVLLSGDKYTKQNECQWIGFALSLKKTRIILLISCFILFSLLSFKFSFASRYIAFLISLRQLTTLSRVRQTICSTIHKISKNFYKRFGLKPKLKHCVCFVKLVLCFFFVKCSLFILQMPTQKKLILEKLSTKKHDFSHFFNLSHYISTPIFGKTSAFCTFLRFYLLTFA